MNTATFTDHPEIHQLIRELQAEGIPSRPFSDLLDPDECQYVDLVMEGGGVWGVALVGYTWVMEQMGIRFRGLAGTSAGAINALLMAASAPPGRPKSPWVLDRLVEMDMSGFMDGPSSSAIFLHEMLHGSSRPALLFHGWRVLGYFKKYLGLHPGDRFREWIARLLAECGTGTTRQLRERHTLPAGMRLRPGISGNPEEIEAKLVLIASDITTESRIQFPEMADLYWEEPDEVNPAEFVRASMSVPGLFHPHRVPLPRPVTDVHRKRWEDRVRYSGSLPETACFVDGGIVSNFPIDVFHIREGVPRLPTFGVKLGVERDRPQPAGTPAAFAAALFNTARHIHDFEFILRHPDYSNLVTTIDTGDHHWLDFSLTPDAQVDLFLSGARAAAGFLREFRWEKYKDIRAGGSVPEAAE